MRRIVEELLKKAKNITPETKHLFEEEVYDEYRNESITSYDRFFFIASGRLLFGRLSYKYRSK